MNNAELIKGLRWCADESICCDDFSGEKCPCFDEKKDSCSVNEILHDAADALEAADKRIVELNTKCADLQSQINSMENEIEELSPKEGEWIAVDDPVWDYFKCSICGNTEISNADKYCRGCGARMKKGANDE